MPSDNVRQVGQVRQLQNGKPMKRTNVINVFCIICFAVVWSEPYYCCSDETFTPSLYSWKIDPDEIVAADAHINWSRFVPMGTLGIADDGFPDIPWDKMKNPVLASTHGAIKNQAVLFFQGWFWFFPAVDTPDGRMYVRTRDFSVYECAEDLGYVGMSPRFLYQDGQWHAFSQLSAPDANRRIYYSTSSDLMHWSKPVESWFNVQKGVRHIDVAVAWDHGRYHVGFKSDQQFHVMRSKSDKLDFQWEEPIAVKSAGWCEAYQFIKIEDQWRMVATARGPVGYKTGTNGYTGDHEPYLFTMEGDGSKAEHWSQWTDKTHIALPFSDWNTVMHANTAYLCDWREYDGWFYLFFSGANDSELCRRRGHCKIGVTRSRDLKKWYLPGEMEDTSSKPE